MRTKVLSWLTVAWVLPLLLGLGLAGEVKAESPTLQLFPDLVEINSFYQGRDVAITGTVPEGLSAVVEVIGPTTQQHFMRKGRRGPLWMNVGEISVSGVPSLYLVLSSAADLLAGNRIDAAWGFPSLMQRISLQGDVQENEKDKFKQQFLELKETEGLYGAWPEGLKVAPAGDGLQKITGKFWLPSNIKPDTYKVCLTTVREGQAVDRVCLDLPVQMVGFPAFFMTMAYQHGALYGILAVFIAIVVGFIMGYLFKGGGGH